MEGKWAVVPGDGTASATFITTQDLGRFVGRLMDAPMWDKESTVVGNEIQFNKLVELAEEIRGKLYKAAMGDKTRLLTQQQAANSKPLTTALRSSMLARSLLLTDSHKSEWGPPLTTKRSSLGFTTWQVLATMSSRQGREL